MKSVKKSKIIRLTGMLFTLLCLITGCGKSQPNITITGGAIPKYAICLETGKEARLSMPILSDREIHNISLTGVEMTENKQINISVANFRAEEKSIYKGYYIYHLPIKISYKDADSDLNVAITALKLNIDSKDVRYEVKDFYICSIEYLEKTYGAANSGTELLLNGNIIGIYESIPDQKHPAMLELISDQEVCLERYFVLNDFLKTEGLNINGAIYKKNTPIAKKYYFSYGNDVGSQNIVRASQVILYSDADSVKKIFVYTPGVYLYPDYEHYGAVKNYIDQL